MIKAENNFTKLLKYQSYDARESIATSYSFKTQAN